MSISNLLYCPNNWDICVRSLTTETITINGLKIYTHDWSLTSSEILNLFTTPVVSKTFAPGQLPVPIFVVGRLNYGTTPYSGSSSDIELRVDAGDFTVINNTYITKSEDVLSATNCPIVPTESYNTVAGEARTFTFVSSGAITAGDGTANGKIYYFLADEALD